MHAVKRVGERSTQDPGLSRTIEEISGRLRSVEMDRDRTD
jgi:hypothetical protein